VDVSCNTSSMHSAGTSNLSSGCCWKLPCSHSVTHARHSSTHLTRTIASRIHNWAHAQAIPHHLAVCTGTLYNERSRCQHLRLGRAGKHAPTVTRTTLCPAPTHLDGGQVIEEEHARQAAAPQVGVCALPEVLRHTELVAVGAGAPQISVLGRDHLQQEHIKQGSAIQTAARRQHNCNSASTQQGCC
jgi:hypothetical protein